MISLKKQDIFLMRGISEIPNLNLSIYSKSYTKANILHTDI